MAPHQYRFAVLDVFSSTPFEGNQLALVHLPLEGGPTREQRHAIAREYNFSETVFLYDQPEGAKPEDGRKTEIWTPFAELPFAGHPTIGAACYCANEYSLTKFGLQLLAGPVGISYDASTLRAKAEIPHNVRIHQHSLGADALLQAFSKLKAITERDGGFDAALPAVSIVTGMTFYLVRLSSLEHLAAVQTGGPRIEESPLDEGWESAVTAPYFYVEQPASTDEPDVRRLRTRMVEPHIGEDPATGSAACTLSTYLSLQKGGASSTHAFELEQGVEMGRRSVIRVTVTLDATGKAIEHVLLAGTAVVTMRGTLTF